tara:strand:- start:678 stop:782 length:105 start_codon:yes stop_codon:yes gene_type:complete
MIEVLQILGQGTLFLMSACMFLTILYLLITDWNE